VLPLLGPDLAFRFDEHHLMGDPLQHRQHRVAEKPPPHIIYKEVLVAAEAGAEYFPGFPVCLR